MLILKQRAAEKNAPLEVVLPHPDVDSLPLGLAGDFQKINASLAVAVAAAHLRHMGYSEIPEDIMGTPLPEKFCRGLVEATWPGRCEIQHQAGVAWCLDGAHTLNSIKLIGTWFANKIKRESFPGQKRVLIFNQQSRDAVPLLDSLHKAIRTAGLCTERLKPFCHVIFCTNMTWENDKAFGAEQAPMMSSGNLIEDLQVQYKCASYWKLMKGEEHTDVTVVRSVEEAVNCARSLRQNCHEFPPPLCLITGSLHLVGSAMEVLEKCF
jgi:folylpolyglutamate synthase